MIPVTELKCLQATFLKTEIGSKEILLGAVYQSPSKLLEPEYLDKLIALALNKKFTFGSDLNAIRYMLNQIWHRRHLPGHSYQTPIRIRYRLSQIIHCFIGDYDRDTRIIQLHSDNDMPTLKQYIQKLTYNLNDTAANSSNTCISTRVIWFHNKVHRNGHTQLNSHPELCTWINSYPDSKNAQFTKVSCAMFMA